MTSIGVGLPAHGVYRKRVGWPQRLSGREPPLREKNAAVAQLVEHVIRNDGVGGSSPFSGTILLKPLHEIYHTNKRFMVIRQAMFVLLVVRWSGYADPVLAKEPVSGGHCKRPVLAGMTPLRSQWPGGNDVCPGAGLKARAVVTRGVPWNFGKKGADAPSGSAGGIHLIES